MPAVTTSPAPAVAAATPDERPRPWLLPTHMLAGVLVQSTGMAVQFMLPYLALQYFQASPWQAVVITAAPTILYTFSIFWQHASRRIHPTVYLLLYWTVAFLPWGLAGASTSFWQLAGLHLLASFGGAAWAPISGDLLNRFYSPAARGRAFGWISAVALLVAAGAGWGAGEWLQSNPESFRFLLPLAAALQLCGVLLLAWLDHLMAHTRHPRAASQDSAGMWALAIDPILHLRQTLRADRLFFRYEAAYMTYGIGWMIAYALLPLIGQKKFDLLYDQYPLYTQLPWLGAMVVVSLPFGWLNDRIGPARMSTLAFTLYTLFPLGLAFSVNPAQLAATCVIWGVCSAAVNVGWMLGPVALAPSPDKVQQYVAIHATMVGLRGTLFQFLGVALYQLTRSFTVPLLIAAAGFCWAAWQMWRLEPDFAQRVTKH